MNRPVFLASIVFFILFCWAPILTADEIVLVNGDRLSGKATRLEDGKLTIKTDYAAEVVIDWEQVAVLKIDSPLNVILIDGTTRKTRAVFYRAGYEDELPGGDQEAAETIEAARVKGLSDRVRPRVRYTARLNAGLSQERGNTDADNFYVNAELIARSSKQRFTFGGETSNQKSDGVNTAESWRAFGKYDYFFSPKWFLYASSLFENDRFADLNLRTTLGAGAGYQIFESDALNLSIAFGPSYVNEDFIVAANDDFAAGQWILNYDQSFFDRLFQLFHSDLATVGLENADKWQIKTRQGLRFHLYKGLTWTFQYNYDYNNDPSPDADSKWDSRLLFLLGYEFQN